MDVEAAVAAIEKDMRGQANPERAEGEKRYLKSDFRHFGVGLPAIRKAAVDAVRENPTRPELLALADRLWAVTDNGTPIHETRMAAIEVLVHRVQLLEAQDIELGERLIRDSKSWAYVDALAIKVVGHLVVRNPSLTATLDEYVRDENFWIRRTALLALLPGIRTDDGDLARLSRYGDLLIGEREFFIRKALGWVLRELSKRDPAWVHAWVADRIPAISGVTIREATRHLPPNDGESLLEAYKAKPK